MDRHQSSLAEITAPVLIQLLVKYSVLKIVREKIFKFYGCTKMKGHLGVFAELEVFI